MTEDLYVESSGKGFPLVMLHGWGMHGGIWDDCIPSLQAQWRVIRPDLPGHGRSRRASRPGQCTARLSEAVARHCPRQMVLLGWSLGGLIAMAMARRLPQRIRRLVLVASSPRFLTGPDWPWGVERPVLESFGQSLAEDYRRTVRDFLALQVRGDERALELLRSLKKKVFAHGEPDPVALRQGLDILADTDLRGELSAIGLPTLVISGERDRLTPPDAGRRASEAIPGSRFLAIPGAAHAPFLSHRDEFLLALTQFLGEAR